MADASGIRAGAAYVEISADRSRLKADLSVVSDDVRRWQSDFEGMGGAGTSMKWSQRIARGAGIGILAHEVGAAMSGIAAAMKGEWEKVDEAIGSVPILGGAAISLAHGFDDLFLHIREGMAKMKEEALAGLKAAQVALAAALRGQALKFDISLIGADPLDRKIMEINEKARRAAEEEKSKAPPLLDTSRAHAEQMAIDRLKSSGALGLGPGLLMRLVPSPTSGFVPGPNLRDPQIMANLALIEERRQKDIAAVYAEQDGKHQEAAAAVFGDAMKYAAEEWDFRIKEREADQELARQFAQEQLERAEEGAQELVRQHEEGTRMLEQTFTPQEKLAKELSDLRERQGELGLSDEEAQRIARKYVEEAARAMPDILGRSFGAAGTFESRGFSELARGGPSDQLLNVQRGAARTLEKIADLMQGFDVAFG